MTCGIRIWSLNHSDATAVPAKAAFFATLRGLVTLDGGEGRVAGGDDEGAIGSANNNNNNNNARASALARHGGAHVARHHRGVSRIDEILTAAAHALAMPHEEAR